MGLSNTVCIDAFLTFPAQAGLKLPTIPLRGTLSASVGGILQQIIARRNQYDGPVAGSTPTAPGFYLCLISL
jgi:hypothetical protein